MPTKTPSIHTPAILLDLDILERNIKNFHQPAATAGKNLWPMIKTHKSTEIARMQLSHGAAGFLCGTLDECEILYENIVRNEKKDISITYAYPVASYPNIERVVKLAQDYSSFYIRIDNHEQAALLNQAAVEAGIYIKYIIIINSGLNRFGIMPYELESLLSKITGLKHLKFCGISTHPGHVYSETNSDGVVQVSIQESCIMKTAAATLNKIGITPKIISTGSTPTHLHIVNNAVINCLHPGNYVFMDNIQISLGCAAEDDCALTVLTTIISAPRDGEFIIDAGAKCLGLDKGAHGSVKIQGHGRVKGVGENMLTISVLSEEVGKITVPLVLRDKLNLKIGHKLEIIPNHSCAVANNTSYFTATRKGIFDRYVHVDMRGNSIRF